MILSIIFPLYNIGSKADRLMKSLNNIDDNLLKEIELIFVDDGSPINEKKYIKDNLQKNYKYYRSKNQGLSLTRFFGLKKATGNYVWFFDPDDYMITSAFEQIFVELKNNDYDVISFGHNIIEIHDEFEKVFPVNIFKKSVTFNFSTSKIYTGMTEGLRSCAMWNKIFKKNFLLNSNIDFNFKGFHEDTYVWMQCLGFIKTYRYIDVKLYQYIVNLSGNSIMRQMEKDRSLNTKYMMDVFNKIFKIYSDSAYTNNSNFKEINKIINHYILSDLKTTYRFYYPYYSEYKKKVLYLYNNFPKFKKISFRTKLFYWKDFIIGMIKKILKLNNFKNRN